MSGPATSRTGVAEGARAPCVGGVRTRALSMVLLLLASGGVIAYCRLLLRTSIVCTHIAYLPIAVAGMWWGKKGIWVAGLLAAFIFSLELWVPAAEPVHCDIVRGVLFLLVGLLVGAVSDRAAAAREAESAAERELAATQRQLAVSDRLASLGQWSAGVAHELNNPLGTILIYSHTLLRHLPEDDPRRADLEMVAAEATRCRDIVRGLLDFARRSRIAPVPTDLGLLVADVLVVERANAPPGVRITSQVSRDLPPMLVDGGQIKQLLLNLVDNGVDAVRGAGEVHISVRLLDDGATAEIAVSDDGCGIAEDDLDRLFTPFFTTKDMGKGTGLGLAIVYGIVKMHGGDISVESDRGKGTTFTIRLPGVLADGRQLSSEPPGTGKEV